MSDPSTEFTTDTRYPKWKSREVTLYRGDDVIDFGTISELAKRRSVTEEYIYWLTTPTAARRAAKNPSKRMIGVVT